MQDQIKTTDVPYILPTTRQTSWFKQNIWYICLDNDFAFRLTSPGPTGQRVVVISPRHCEISGFTSFSVLGGAGMPITVPVLAPAPLVWDYILPVVDEYEAWRLRQREDTAAGPRCPAHLFMKLRDELIKTKEAICQQYK